MSALMKCLGDEGVESYKKAQNLSEIESKNDPDTEPYRSKYKARELCKNLKSKIKDKLDECGENSSEYHLFSLLSLFFDQLIGHNYIDTEESSEGEDYLMGCLKKIEDNEFENVVSMHIHILNSLGILWSGRGLLENCMDYFTRAEKLYHEFKQNDGNNAPYAYNETVEAFPEDENEKAHQRSVSFESLHTHTLYYLAQGHAKLGNSSLSAQHCHMTLQRQLKAGDYNPVDWSLNAATLSQYYLTVEKFTEARHCLASGTSIFETGKKNTEELSEEEKELQSQREADIARCWIKYGLAILEASRDKMLGEVESSNEDDSSENENAPSTSSNAQLPDHNADIKDSAMNSDVASSKSNETAESEKPFEEFELELTSYEECITDKLVRVFDAARGIFLFIVGKIEQAKEYYNLEGHACDGVELTQDHSRAFKLLAFFELDMQRQCRMHKRRVDMLSDILKELNPKYYLLICRQLMFELAETFSAMVDLKFTLVELDNSLFNQHGCKKINALIYQSIERYHSYIDSLNVKNELIEEFPEGDVRPALVAYFCIGRLYTKILEQNQARRIAFMEKSCEYYSKLIEYCAKHASAKELVSSELEICQEMVTLLPLKIQRIKQQSS